MPDECEADCNRNGRLDRLDIIPYGVSYDCNFNLVPDECEADCNHNGLLDACDIARGFSGDCDGDGLPDECDLDGTPPELSMTIDREFLWPPDHRMVEVTGTVVGHDDCGGVEISPPEIASNEPDDAPGHEDGATRDDIGKVEFDGQRFSVRLRAERAGGWDRAGLHHRLFGRGSCRQRHDRFGVGQCTARSRQISRSLMRRYW